MMLGQIVKEQLVPDVEILGITDDSRQVAGGYLFLAVPGEKFDGRDYLQDAIEKGAVAAVCEAPAPEINDIPVIPLEKLASRAGVLASRFYGEPSEQMTIVAVTGTNGKTSFTHLLTDALNSRSINCGLIGTMGHGRPGSLKEPGLTTPPAVDLQRRLKELLNEACDVTVLEASSHGIVQHRLAGCHVDIAVLTNITHDHLDYHKTMDAYRSAKEKLFHLPGLSCAVINRDDEFAQELIKRLPESVDCIDYSMNTKDDSGEANVSLSSVVMHERGMSISLVCQGEKIQADLPLFGSFNVQNILAVAATLVAMKWQGRDIEQALKSLRPVPGRMEVLRRDGKSTIVVDYAHTPDSLEKILVAVREHYPGGQVSCIFGCGGDRDAAKRPLMGEIASRLADRVLVTSDNPRSEDPAEIINEIVAGIKGEYSVEPDRAIAISTLLEAAGEQDIVLIAGKGHETYQEIATGRIPYSDFDVINKALSDMPSVAIVGVGATGLSYARYLQGANQAFSVFDDNPSEHAIAQLEEIVGESVSVQPLRELNAGSVSEIYLSPGVPLAQADVSAARGRGVRIHGDVAMLGDLANAPVIVITGTNGKSTVAHLVHALIAGQGRNAVLAGNVGTPVLDVLSDEADCYVLEASSYQLELADKLPSEVAVVLNLAPDHMDRYPDLDTYYRTKLAVYDHCGAAVINRALQSQVTCSAEHRATFGTDCGAGLGHFGLVEEDGEYLLLNGSEVLISSAELQLSGTHNLENALAALAIGWLLKLDMPRMLETLRDFSGLPHRGEVVAIIDGVKYINDSKATNPGAMVSAVQGCAGDVHLIAGGDTKGLDFVGAVSSIGHLIDSLVVIGAKRDHLARELSELDALACDNMIDAVRAASEKSRSGDVVLLSPGCASLDQYRNYEERGDAFRDAIGRLSI